MATLMGVVLSIPSILAAAEPNSIPADNYLEDTPKRVTLGWTKNPPIIDGKMDDASWAEAGLVSEMRQVIPLTGQKPSQRTEIRILTDGKTLFVGFRCYDTNPEQIIANRKQRDTFPFFDDRVGFSIDTFNTHRNGYFFATNPNAMRHDVLLEGEDFSVDWDTIWYVETSVDSEGWTAEIAIPFSSIGFDPNIDTWGINFERGIRRNDEDIRWADHAPQRFISSMGTAGVLEGVRGIDQGLGLQLTPGLTVRRIDDVDTDDRFEIDPTFDGFYKILPSVTASVTVNTDFGQVEVDDVQINDSRFALFFPEKRDFFLQDGLIFDFGDISRNGRPFFSRRIGNNASGPIDILGGGKLTGRLGPVKFGFLDTFVEHKNGTSERNLFVGRVAANVLGQSTVGVIVTNGDPLGGRNSTTIGTDFLYRNTDFMGGKNLRASLWYAKSIDGNNTSDSNNNGYGIKLEYPNDRNNWVLGFEELQADYQPRLGFVNRNDMRHLFGSYRYRIRPSSGPFRKIDSDVFGQIFWDSSNDVETVRLRVTPLKFTSPINDGFDFSYLLRREKVQLGASLLFEIPGDNTYTFHEMAFKVFTSRNRPVRMEGAVGYGTFFDGTRTRVDFNLELRPSHYFFFELEYEYRDLNFPHNGPEGTIGAGRKDRDIQLIRLKFDLLFSPNIIWSNFIQYDNVSDQAGLNSRFRFILRDGREFFIVFNQGLTTDKIDNSGVRTNRNNLERKRTEVLFKGVWTLTF